MKTIESLACNSRNIGPIRSAAGAGRDALPLDPRQHIRWSCPLHRVLTIGRPAAHRAGAHYLRLSIDCRIEPIFSSRGDVDNRDVELNYRKGKATGRYNGEVRSQKRDLPS